MSLNVPCNKFPRDNVPCDNVPRYNVPRNNVPHSNCSVPLQMVISKEDGPLDDQNQRDELAQIVANEHLDDPASSVLLRSFAKRTVLGMTDISLVGWR